MKLKNHFPRSATNQQKLEGTSRIISEVWFDQIILHNEDISLRDSLTSVHGIVTPDTPNWTRVPLWNKIKLSFKKKIIITRKLENPCVTHNTFCILLLIVIIKFILYIFMILLTPTFIPLNYFIIKYVLIF